MNIFVLDTDVKLCAEFHCNKHIVKMPLETAQLLSTVQRLRMGVKTKALIKLGDRSYNQIDWFQLPTDTFENTNIGKVLIDHVVYRPTHVNHPCLLWLLESRANYEWTYDLFIALSNEYERRYKKEHRSYKQLSRLLKHIPSALPAKDMTPFAQAMPDDCKDDDAVVAYRNYYNKHKAPIAKWMDKQPEWFTA